ncbi:hypothetical protein SLE2022_004300 [Rubroshorea leprosula]
MKEQENRGIRTVLQEFISDYLGFALEFHLEPDTQLREGERGAQRDKRSKLSCQKYIQMATGGGSSLFLRYISSLLAPFDHSWTSLSSAFYLFFYVKKSI